MKSQDLGLPIEYQCYPEYFDTLSLSSSTQDKNQTIQDILRKYQSKDILDMACGTGAQVFYLKQLGYNVIGSDFSPGLLKIARNKALKKNIDIEFIDGDMRNVQVGQFDTVITIDNAIGHLVKNDFSIAIRNIHKNLRESGIYVFDILNLAAMTDEVIEADNQKMMGECIASDGTIIHNVRHASIDRNNGIFTTYEMITLQNTINQKQIKNKCSLQIYSMNDLNDILSKNSFKIIEQYKIDAYTFHKDEQGYSILTVAMKD